MPVDRIRVLNSLPIRREGASYVLYWSQMNRRAQWNHGLEYAATLANELALPLFVYEALTCTYNHANDRLHTFILEGVRDTAEELRRRGAGYAFYLRRRRTDPNDLLYRLSADAALVVTDDYPTFIAARHNASVPSRIGVAFHAVDSSCIVPMNRFEKREWAAYTIRPKIHRLLPEYLKPCPPVKLARRWTAPPFPWQTEVDPARISSLVAECEIDHSVKPSTLFRGGSAEAQLRLRRFLESNLRRYARERNEPSAHATSNLSPYLHFGNISSLQVAMSAREHAAEHSLVADEFLEELIVRRELAFNFARHTPGLESLDSLPDWALKTLGKHDTDRRDPIYSPKQFEAAATHDRLWNATQKEMLLRGKIHGYYRMYWGKKIIEWSPTHADALRLMIHLHDRYAIDGRDPATYTNILWCFGLHDRPWTERPVFGQIRYMGFDGMKRKTNIEAYIREIEHLERTGQDLAK